MRLVRRLILSLINWVKQSGKNKSTNRRCKMPNVAEAVSNTFKFIKFGSKMKAKQDKVRGAFKVLEVTVNELKDSREKSLAKTSIEEGFLWASRAVRSEQVDRNARNR